MKFHINLILAIVKKDVLGLLPLIGVGCVVFLLQPVIASLDTFASTGEVEFLMAVQANFYWVSFFLASLLMISVLQQDPADSLTHDWLARPVPRLHWLLAKLLFMVLVIVLPIVTGRFVLFLSQGYGVWHSIVFAAAIEKLPVTLVVPVLFAAGLLTPNLRRTILVLMLVMFVFLLPAWSVTRPLLEMLGIKIGTEFDSMAWLQGVPVVMAGLAGAGAVFWWLVCRRSSRAARQAFAVSILAIFITVFPPAWLLDWDRVIAVHQSLINQPDSSLDDTVVMEPLQACYPASVINTDGRSMANPLLAYAGWSEQQLETAGASALTLATTVRARPTLTQWIPSLSAGRDIGVDWRVERILTRAVVSAGSLASERVLTRSTTAENRFAPIADVDTDYWLIPDVLSSPLAGDDSAKMTIRYDLALLSPQAFELPVDGAIRHLPSLGSCRARLDAGDNTIEVDCIKRGEQPALVSAELTGVPASRVDSYYRASFTPRWLEALSRRQTRLILDKSALVDSSSVLVMAYQVERILRKQLTTNGLLGDTQELCPLPQDDGQLLLAASSWRDSAAHQVGFVAVEQGVRVEVLDWRTGQQPDAPTLLLIPGLGATAHSFDELAAKLSQRYNVVAMTRRGTGASAKPDRGYDIGRLSQDVLQVIDAMDIRQPILVGHSIAGEELSYLGVHHADQISALIYLDAAYDRVSPRDPGEQKRYRELNALLPPQPPVRPTEAESYAALKQYALRTQGNSTLPPEGEIMASYDLSTGINRHDRLYLDAIMMGLQAPQYTRIPLPALSLYAVPMSASALMENWYDPRDVNIQQAVGELFEMEAQRKVEEMTRFETEVPDSTVIAIPDADHWIFLSHEAEVLSAIDEFVGSRVAR